MKIAAICLIGLMGALSLILSVAAIKLAAHPHPKPVLSAAVAPGTVGASLDPNGKWHCPAAYPQVQWIPAVNAYICTAAFNFAPDGTP